MITTIALADIAIMSYNYHFFFVVRTFKIYSLSNFHVYDTVLLTIITMLCIRPSGLTHLTIQVEVCTLSTAYTQRSVGMRVSWRNCGV